MANWAPAPAVEDVFRVWCEPGFRTDPEFIREQRREAREQLLVEQEDFEYRAPVRDGDDWTGNVNE